MKQAEKTHTVLIIIACVLLLVAVVFRVFTACYNWENHKDLSCSLSANISSVITDYYACNSDRLSICQTKGDSSCEYEIYYKSRNESDFTLLGSNISFSENDMSIEPYSLAPHRWNDICFKIVKTSGTDVYSELDFYLFQSTDS